MVDEKTTGMNGVGNGAAGSSANQNASSNPVDDARIIDEVVIAPPKPKAANTSPVEVPNTSPLPPKPAPPMMQKFSSALSTLPESFATQPPIPPLTPKPITPEPPKPVVPSPAPQVLPTAPKPVEPPTLQEIVLPPPAPRAPLPPPPPQPTPQPQVPAPKPPIPPASPLPLKPITPQPESLSAPQEVARHEDLPPPARDTQTQSSAPSSVMKGELPQEAKEDLQKLLSGIKLPERREVPDEQNRKSQTVYDTSLATLTDKKIGMLEEKGVSGAPTSELISYPNTEKTERIENAPAQNAPAQEKKDVSSSIVMPFRTFKNDFQDIVREKKISLVRAAAFEQDKKREDKFTDLGVVQERRRRTFNIIFISLLLALLGSAAFFGAAFIMSERKESVATTPTSSILFSEISVPFSVSTLSSFDVKNILVQARAGNNASLGTISRIVPVKDVPVPGSSEGATEEVPLTLAEFFASLGVVPPPDLLRALSDEFFFGIHTVDENAPLLIVPVEAYERAFAGMLEWERTMNSDLAPVFTSVPGTTVGADGLLTRRAFEDTVMRNYDVRALKDDNGEIQLYYSFPTRNLLIIAENAYSFAEILSRLRAERKL